MKTNKYQEALDNAKDDIEYRYNDSFEEVPKERLDEIKLLQELVDKQKPQKVKKELIAFSNIHNIVVGTCLNCGEGNFKENGNYCSNCGQHLNWEIENDTENDIDEFNKM